MRISQGVGNTQVTGAASTLRVRWPRGITDGGDNTGVSKFGPQELNGFTTVAFGGGTQQTLVNNGAASIDGKSTAGPSGWGVGYSRRLSWLTERPGGPILDGWSCWSFRATLAFDNPAGGVAGDIGIVITCGNQNSVNGDGLSTEPGVIFGVTNTSTLTMRARAVNAGPQTVTDVISVANTPDITKFNTYELQVITGSNTSDPVLFGLINGTVVTPRRSWTAASAILPGPAAIAGNLGYNFYVINRGGGVVANMYIHEVLLTAGQSAADLT